VAHQHIVGYLVPYSDVAFQIIHNSALGEEKPCMLPAVLILTVIYANFLDMWEPHKKC